MYYNMRRDGLYPIYKTVERQNEAEIIKTQKCGE